MYLIIFCWISRQLATTEEYFPPLKGSGKKETFSKEAKGRASHEVGLGVRLEVIVTS